MFKPNILDGIIYDLKSKWLHYRLHCLLLQLFCLLLTRIARPSFKRYLLKLGFQVSDNKVYCRRIITAERYYYICIPHRWLYVLIICRLDKAVILIENTLNGPASLTAISKHYIIIVENIAYIFSLTECHHLSRRRSWCPWARGSVHHRARECPRKWWSVRIARALTAPLV